MITVWPIRFILCMKGRDSWIFSVRTGLPSCADLKMRCVLKGKEL